MTPARPLPLPGCAVLSQALGEPAAGTASAIRSWLLLERRGPWSASARDDVLEAVLPPDRLAELARVWDDEGLRPLLIRRPGRRRGGPLTVLLASSIEGRVWIERLLVDDLREIARVDFARLAAGVPGQGEPVAGPVFLVCTHGAKDMCCAVSGRPVAAALARAEPAGTWECTHVGGDRFAANVVALPDGLMYARVPPERATELALAARAGRLLPDLLRGRSRDPRAAQAAEIAVRRDRDLTASADVALVRTEPAKGGVCVHLLAQGEPVEVLVDEVTLDCGGHSRCAGELTPNRLRTRLVADRLCAG